MSEWHTAAAGVNLRHLWNGMVKGFAEGCAANDSAAGRTLLEWGNTVTACFKCQVVEFSEVEWRCRGCQPVRCFASQHCKMQHGCSRPSNTVES